MSILELGMVVRLWIILCALIYTNNKQGMAVEGERIWIASEECFTSINHSFDGSALGETSFVCFSCRDIFEVLP